MAFGLSRKEATPEMHQMVEKNCHNQNNYEDSNKLESRISERADRYGGKVFIGLQYLRMTMRNTTKNYLDTPEESKRRG